MTVIPARGGSKGVKRKNLQPLLRKPLIYYPIRVARLAGGVDHFIVSTDDEEIAAYARSQGADVPFLRPPDLANDGVLLIHVMKHALEFFDLKGERFDAIMSIQATAPALLPETVDAVVDKFHRTGTDAVVTVSEVVHGHPLICKKLQEDEVLKDYFDIPPGMPRYPRQARQPAYYPNGAVFLRDRKLLVDPDPVTNSLGRAPMAVLMDREDSVNIDDHLDFAIAEFWLGRRQVNK